jgi:hypothetical protein
MLHFPAMLIRTIALLVLLASTLAYGQPLSLPAQVKSARKVFIENEAGDTSVLDSAHLVLASSRFNWVDDKGTADLVFSFNRNASTASRTVKGDAISIAIRNTYTLEVTDEHGTIIWKSSTDLSNSNVRKDRTERSWIEYLHHHPAAQLVDKFLAATEQSR